MLSDKLSVIVSIKQPAKASSYKKRIGFLEPVSRKSASPASISSRRFKRLSRTYLYLRLKFLPVQRMEIQIERDTRSWKGQLKKTRNRTVFSWKA